jgi:dTMP kinase
VARTAALEAVGETPGCLLTLEGGEGSGKTTQCGLLVKWLRASGIAVTTAREPGGTGLGERLRALLLRPDLAAVDPLAEVLLFAAARCQAVAEVVGPALARGEVVVCDRFVDSSLAYQGFGLGVDPEFIRCVNRRVTRGAEPDLTLLFDIPPPVGAARRRAARPDRIEARAAAYHEAVRRGYLELARAEPHRFRILDGTRSEASIHLEVRAAVALTLSQRGFALRDDPVADARG